MDHAWRIKVMQTLLFAALLGISLQSYYFASVGMSPFPIAGATVLLGVGLWTRGFAFGLPPRLIYALVVLLVLFLYLLEVDLIRRGTFSKGLASGVVAAGTLIGAYALLTSHRGRDAFPRALSAVLLVHVCAWAFQALYWVATGEYVDLLAPVTGEAQRVWSAKGAEWAGVRVPRFSGLFNEPGTYSVYVFTLLAMYHQVVDRVDKLGYLIPLTMLLSFSLFGFVLVGAYVIITLAARREFKALMLGAVAAAVGAIVVLPAVQDRLLSDYSGVGLRSSFAREAFSSESLLFGVTNLGDLPLAYNDLGIPFYLFVSGGVIAIALFFGMLVNLVCSRGWTVISLLMLVLATKVKLSYPLLWLYLGVVYAWKLGVVPAAHVQFERCELPSSRANDG